MLSTCRCFLCSVSTITSKFGVTLLPSNRGVILDKYKAYTWLNGLHIHVGSQVLFAKCHSSAPSPVPVSVRSRE